MNQERPRSSNSLAPPIPWRAVLALAALGSPAAAQGDPVTLLFGDGDTRRLDCVFVMDQSSLEYGNPADVADYNSAVASSIFTLLRTPPFSTYADDMFNVHRVNEAGGEMQVEIDQLIVVFDLPQVSYAVFGGDVFLNVVQGYALPHEIGHSLALLHDEYDTIPLSQPGGGMPGGVFGEDEDFLADHRNVTTYDGTNPDESVKWTHWFDDPLPPLPTPLPPAYAFPPGSPGIGTFEGAVYSTSGVFRPRHTCHMRTTAQPFCAVCREVLTSKLYGELRSTARSLVPAPGVRVIDPAALPGGMTFTVDPVRPDDHNLTITWLVGGNVVQTGGGGVPSDYDPADFQLTLTQNELNQLAALGLIHDIKAVVVDSADTVRVDYFGQMADEFTWRLFFGIGGVVFVPEQFPTISAALALVPPDGIIDIGPGQYDECLTIRGNQSVTLYGREGADATLVDGGGFCVPMTLDGFGAVTLEGLTFQNGANSVDEGGGIRAVKGKRLDILDCQVRANQALRACGIYAADIQAVNIDHTRVVKNFCEVPSPGGILVESVTSLCFVNNTVARNSSGAIELEDIVTPVEFRNCIVEGNQVYGLNGVGSTVVIAGYSDFFNNGADATDNLIGTATDGVGYFEADPLFIDPVVACDFRVLPGSPCIDTGDRMDPFVREPEDNGDRINLGYCGNRPCAQLSSLDPAPFPDVASVVFTEMEQVAPNFHRRIDVAALDPAGAEVLGAFFAYEAMNGTIDQNGYYTAPAVAGEDVITVTVEGTSISEMMTVRVLDYSQDYMNPLPPNTTTVGDFNGDGALQITDAVNLLDAIFNEPVPLRAYLQQADVNGDGAVDISDPILLLDYLFVDPASPVNPGPVGGTPLDEDAQGID